MRICRRQWAGLWAFVLVLCPGWCHAQSATPDQEYQKLIHVDQGIQPLGAHPFGENINPYNGSLSFNVTDVSLRGNGPTITIGRTWRTYEWVPQDSEDPQFPFGSWDLDIPRIETLVASGGGIASSAIWQTGLGGSTPTAGTTQRCTTFTAPPGIKSTLSEGGWVPDEWWYGYNLLVPGQGKQQLMPRYSANPLSPTISGKSFPIVTKNNWMIGCGVTADDGGEGFLAIAPDGTRYTFAHLLYRPYFRILGAGGPLPPDGVNIATSSQAATSQSTASGSVSNQAVTPMVGAPGGIGILARRDALMYVTQIQDRFGNTLTYHYDPTTGYLSSITASDGREVDVTYVSGSPSIKTITAKASNATPRTWTYTYTSGALAGVQLPDGSAWSYQMRSGAENISLTRDSNCSANLMPTVGDGNFSTPTTAGVLSGTSTFTMTAPSGLTGTFGVAMKLSGRSYTPQVCYGEDNGTHPISVYPEWYVQDAITSEVLSGAGMPTRTWTYSYSPANASWNTDACAISGTCPTTVYTDVTDPGGSDTRYTYSNRFDVTEGQLLRTDTYSGSHASTLVRSVVDTYADASGGPWPSVYGADLLFRDNYFQEEQLTPLSKRTITQGGNTYTWQTESFDAYAQPTDVKRSNNIAGQTPIEETTAYLNDTNHWVLGLPETVTNKSKGEVESSNTYNSLDELTARARFGQTLMHYTWNSAGQLASFTDGDSHTTTLGSYVRGIPTAIGYPDGTHESLAVDDLGQITAITDQGGNTTHYSYDALGRIAKITYPYDSSTDSASWYPKTFSYSYVTGAERGLAAGHWRRTTTQGAATDTTYFDAELRPVLDDTSNGSAHISTATGYDWRGLTTFASYPVSGSPELSSMTTGTHSTYDALGRLTKTQQDSELGTLTTATAYLSGARKQVTDPKGNVTTTTYQVFDQPTYGTVLKVQAPTGITQTTTRDVYGHPLSITQSGSYGTESDHVTKTLVYDSAKRLCRTTEPETGSTIMAYDGANNLAWSAEGIAVPSTDTDCAQNLAPAAARTTRTYDAMNRVLTIAPPSGTQGTVYTYDALGHVHTAVSSLATQGYAYNSLGGLTGESLVVAGSGYTWSLRYGYDAYGHRASVTYPAGTGSAETVSYAPDAWGRPTRVGSYATGVSYWPNGQVHGFTYVGGTLYLADQNARQLTSNFTYGAGSTLALSEDRAYDKDGNLTTVTDLVDGTRSQSFGYDALNRLTSASAPHLYGTESYSYDPINNLRTRLIGGVTASYNYDATNKLASITQGATTVDRFTYDAQGDEIAKNGTTLTYDAKHQLTGIPGIDSYAYDAAGRRVEKLATGSSYPEYAFYDQAGQLMYRYAPGAGTATNYIYLGAKLVAHHVNAQLAPVGGIRFSANPSNGSTTVSWGAVPTATSYTLEQSSGGGSSWSTVTSGSATSVARSGLAGGRYLYRVQACAGGTCGGWTVSPTLGVRPALPTVTTPAGTVNGTYTVSWTAVTGATGYTVQERLNGGAWTTLASNTTATSISRPGTTTGSYTYQVEALNSYGSRGWAASSAVAVNTAYGVVPTPTPSLSVPTTSATGNVTVSWHAAAPVTGYVLQQSSNGGSTWSTVYSGMATSAARSGLANGSYTYRVQACNTAGGGSACTAWATGGPLVVTHPPASAPSLSVPATSSTGSYTVSWGSVSTATSYTLQQSTNGGSNWSTAYSGSARSKALSGRGNGTYTYRVEACNAGGCGAWSGSKSMVVTHPPASAPSLSVPATSSTGSYTVSWGAVSTATSYTLQQSSNGGSSWSTAYSGSARSKALSGLGNGTYTYRVEACNAGGCGPWSSVGTVAVALVPATPTLTVKQSPGASGHIMATLSWTAEPTATTYVAQEDAGGTVSQIYTGSGTTWLGGYTGALRSFRVEACNSVGCSSWTGWQ